MPVQRRLRLPSCRWKNTTGPHVRTNPKYPLIKPMNFAGIVHIGVKFRWPPPSFGGPARPGGSARCGMQPRGPLLTNPPQVRIKNLDDRRMWFRSEPTVRITDSTISVHQECRDASASCATCAVPAQIPRRPTATSAGIPATRSACRPATGFETIPPRSGCQPPPR